MPVATTNFSYGQQFDDGEGIDILRLQDFVMAALDRHFLSYDQAAAAQAEYRRVQADIDADANLTLFGTSEAVHAGLAAHPMALAWSEFEREAAGQIEPVRFSIKFTG